MTLSTYVQASNKSNLLQDIGSFAITVIPIAGLTFLLLSSQAIGVSFILSVVVFPLLTLFQCRLILIIHELGHQSLFTSSWANCLAGLLASTLTLVPVKYTANAHSVHHQFNGNWAMYKGPMYVVEVDVFESFKTRSRFLYLLTRRLELIWITAVLQNLIIPRLRLFRLKKTNSIDPIQLDSLGANLFNALIYNSQYLPMRTAELIDTLLATFFGGLCLYYLACNSLITALIYGMSIILSLSIVTIIFHVNHNFPGSYATTFARWDKRRVIIEGTSNIVWNPIFHWFTLNFGFHQMHHANPGLHFTQLSKQSCQDIDVKSHTLLRLRDFPNCFRYILWSASKETFITFEDSCQGMNDT